MSKVNIHPSWQGQNSKLRDNIITISPLLNFHLHDHSVVNLWGNIIQVYLELCINCSNCMKKNPHTAISKKIKCVKTVTYKSLTVVL